MILGIDASNIRGGGGVTHLVDLLRYSWPQKFGFEKVYIWASKGTLGLIDNQPWLIKQHDPVFEDHYLKRALWQHYRLGRVLREKKCDLLFVPGGSFSCDFNPVVTMSQNLLPFELKEMLRFGISFITMKMMLLRLSQKKSFQKAEGIIFLTQYARQAVLKVTGQVDGYVEVIPHGLDRRFFMNPRHQRAIEEYNEYAPFKVLYVSTIEPYKHQLSLVEAFGMLRDDGYPVELVLIGSARTKALKRLNRVISQIDPNQEFIKYIGLVSHNELHIHYHSADLAVFASSCENMPIILMENMASGLPIACSDSGPMFEILADAGVYFDPEKPESIAHAITELLISPKLRIQKASLSYKYAKDYSWKLSADRTFSFLSKIANPSLFDGIEKKSDVSLYSGQTTN